NRPAGGTFTVATQTTVGDANVSRWLGAAAQDHQGNHAVRHSGAQDEKRPSIAYSGRLANDPTGMMRPEVSLIEGTGVQRAFGFRWGDYSAMSIDPSDDC